MSRRRKKNNGHQSEHLTNLLGLITAILSLVTAIIVLINTLLTM
jgi:hypothetical protein